jgi:hypothetical protein
MLSRGVPQRHGLSLGLTPGKLITCERRGFRRWNKARRNRTTRAKKHLI